MRRQPPTSNRYLLARLRPLTRPIFWGPSIVLVLVLLFTWELWTRPELLSYLGINNSSSQPDEAALTAEDRAIGADIDTLPLLLNDFGISASVDPNQSAAKSQNEAQPTNLATLPGVPIAGTSARPPSTGNSGLFGDLTQPTDLQQFGVPGANATTPNGQATGASEQTSSQTLLQTPFAAATQQQTLANTFPALSSSTSNSLPQSPLEAALAKYAAPDPTAANLANRPPATPSSFTPAQTASGPIEGSTSLGSFGVNAATPNPAVNSFTNLVEGVQPVSGDQNSLAGSALSSPAQFSNGVSNGTLAPSIPPNALPLNSAQPSPVQGLGASPNAFAPQPSTEVIPSNNVPLSAPRPIPGRFIGGGQINTFSNP